MLRLHINGRNARDVLVQNNVDIYKCLHWATQFELHIPPVEDLRNILYRGV